MQPSRSTRILTALALGLLAVSCGGGGNPIIDTQDDKLIQIKTANTTTYDTIGQVIAYSFAVSNTGNLAIIPPITIDDDRTANESCPAVTTVGNGDSFLDPGETIVCTASYTITLADLVAGAVTNTATASGRDPDLQTVTSDPDSATIRVALIASFTPNAPSAAPRISMESGSANASLFEVRIEADSIVDFYGVAFTLLYDPLLVEYVGCDAASSILTSSGSGSIPFDYALVGVAMVTAQLENGIPGFLNVRGSKVGLVGGVPNGTGLVLTLTFQALAEMTNEPLSFESGPSREVLTCPQDLSPCSMPMLPYDEGTVTAVPG
jgi:hypothetical protein